MAKTFLYLAIIFVFSFSVAAETIQHNCRLDETIEIEGPSTYHALDFAQSFNQYFERHCYWNIIKPTTWSYLNLTSASIWSADSIAVTGVRNGKTLTLFHKKGKFFQKSQISLAGYSSVRVTLTLKYCDSYYNNCMDDQYGRQRSFSALYYANTVFQLPQSKSQWALADFKNMAKSISKVNLEFQTTDQVTSADQLLMLNFTAVPVNANSNVTVDGVQLNSTSARMFLQSPSSPSVTLTLDMPQVEPIAFRYWYVSRKCSQKVVLKVGEPARAILHLNETERMKLSNLPVRCAMHLTTDGDNQFGIHLLSSSAISDSADSVYFYDATGQVVLAQNYLEGPISTAGAAGNVLIGTRTAVVIYDSPYIISPNADYRAPQIEAFSKEVTQNSVSKNSTVRVKSHSEWCGPQQFSTSNRQLLSVKFESLAVNGDADDTGDFRAFFAVYPNNSAIRLSKSIGQVTFPLGTGSRQLPTRKSLLKFMPEPHFSDHLLLLNFTQVPVNASSKVAVDGVLLNSTSPTMFLQTPSSSTIAISVDMPQTEPITFRWWLVRKSCSEKVVLKYGEQGSSIRRPTAQQEHNKIRTPTLCAMHYSTEEGYQLGVHLPGPIALAHPSDALYFYSDQGRVVLEWNHLAGRNGSGAQNSLIEANTAVIIYESAHVDNLTNTDFQAPQIKAILTQVTQINLNKDTPVEVKILPNENTIQLLISKDDFVNNMELAYPSLASLQKLEASPRVPIAALFEYVNLRVTLRKNDPVRKTREIFSKFFPQ